jgi:hypothetical protein
MDPSTSVNNSTNVLLSYATSGAAIAKQKTIAFIIEVDRVRKNPEIFQKICQIGEAVIGFMIAYSPRFAYLTGFKWNLEKAAHFHDFWRVLYHPSQLISSVNCYSIDEYQTHASLVKLLVKQENLPVNDFIEINGKLYALESGSDADKRLKQLEVIAKNYLHTQLSSMDENNDSYQDVEAFKSVLQRRIEQNPWLTNVEGSRPGTYESIAFDASGFPLTDLQVTLRTPSLAERITHILWRPVDWGTVFLDFKEWNLVDTAKWAARFSDKTGIEWVKNQDLVTWVMGAVCVNFGIQLFEACRKLCDEKGLTADQKKALRQDALYYFAEVISNGMSFMNHVGIQHFDHHYLQLARIGAKSIGVWCFFNKPKIDFFAQMPTAGA